MTAMKSMQVIGANVVASGQDGNDIHVAIYGNTLTTCWSPTEQDIENLAAGGYVRVVAPLSPDEVGSMTVSCVHPFPPD